MTVDTSSSSGSPRPVSDEDLAGDLVSPGDPRFGVIWINPDRMSATPCFFGTRVPVSSLFDYLRAGETIPAFIDDFPGVTVEQVTAVLRLAGDQFRAPPRRAA